MLLRTGSPELSPQYPNISFLKGQFVCQASSLRVFLKQICVTTDLVGATWTIDAHFLCAVRERHRTTSTVT